MENMKDVKVLDTDIPAEEPDDYTVVTARWSTIEATISPPR
jgi:hypothetical protein